MATSVGIRLGKDGSGGEGGPTTADLVTTTYTPTNFSIEANDLESVIEAVDTALGTIDAKKLIVSQNVNTSAVDCPWGGGYTTIATVSITAKDEETAFATFSGTFNNYASTGWQKARVRITVDGVAVASVYDSKNLFHLANDDQFFSFSAAIPNLSAGTVVIRGQIEFSERSAGTVQALAGCRLVCIQHGTPAA